ncbi:MAG TPA: cytochrome c1 [Steroidobacteraceae bacterium]|nr:cytochrome c1 [Steroidobacteraceae bacterium]
MRNAAIAVTLLALGQGFQVACALEEPAAALDWQDWHAGNEVTNTDSLQRGARNFVNYCSGCHSIKYLRYSRMARDLKIPTEQLKLHLLPAGATPADYFQASIVPADAAAWFGKEPPDLSLIARSRGPDTIYRFLKTFYLDPSRPTRSNNLVLNNPAMPAVLSELEGVKAAVYKGKKFDHFVTVSQGQLSPAQFDGFVRDTVNFLDYAGEPAQADRRSIGVWVVLFLLMFTWMAWLLKKEYWKDVH